MIYVGIDVGGTGIQVGLVDESGKILCKGGIVTRTDIPFDMQVKAMADCVLETIDKGGYTLGDVKAIGAGAFLACGSLEEIVLPAGLEFIGEDAFYGASLKKIYVPKSARSHLTELLPENLHRKIRDIR